MFDDILGVEKQEEIVDTTEWMKRLKEYLEEQD